MFDYVEIIPAVIAALTAGGWLVSRHKRKQDEEEHKTKIEAMEAKITSSLRDSETKYTREAIEIYNDQVVKPIREQSQRNTEKLARLEGAIALAPNCRIYPDCIILKKLRGTPLHHDHDTKGSDDLERHSDFDPC